MNLRRIKATGAALALAATGLVACNTEDAAQTGGSGSDGEGTLRIGTTDSGTATWDTFEDKAKEEGVDIQIVPFGDYNQPNEALSQGQLDVNQFQTLKFLANYNVGSGQHLVPVGSTEIVPLALYWKDHDSLDDIEGEEVAIPNDPANQGRAINVLAQADLLTLKSDDLVDPTPADIDEGASKVKITTVDAAQTSVAYNEGKPAIINNSFLDRAGIDPTTAVFKDDPESKEAEIYINTFVTTEENKDDPRIAQLVEIWHSPEVQAAIEEDSEGTSVPVRRSNSELEEILQRVEDASK